MLGLNKAELVLRLDRGVTCGLALEEEGLLVVFMRPEMMMMMPPKAGKLPLGWDMASLHNLPVLPHDSYSCTYHADHCNHNHDRKSDLSGLPSTLCSCADARPL